MHKLALLKGIHPSKHMQLAFDKYGFDAFYFEPIEIIDKSIPDFEKYMIERENYYISLYKSNIKDFGYNIRVSAESNFGSIHSEFALTRIKGKKLSQETKNKMALSRTGEKHHSIKVNEKQVKIIRILIAKGYRNSNIAKYFKVSKSVINDIKNNGSWSHVVVTDLEINEFDDNSLKIDYSSRLNRKEVLLVKWLISEKFSLKSISEFLSKNKSVIRHIKNGNTSKNIKLTDDEAINFKTNYDINELKKIVVEQNDQKMKKIKDNALRGSSNPFSKLTEVDVLEIKKMIEEKHSLLDISKKFNVSIFCISKIKTGKNWSHITGFAIKSGLLKGIEHPNSKYDNEIVLDIISLTNIGLTTKEICNLLSLEKSFVNRVKSGKTRSEITGIKYEKK